MSQLTRKAIMKCTLELAEKKSLKKITVKDIADECGITRSTFYYHFSDIYDVLDGVVQAKIDEFNEEYNGEMDKVLMRFIEYSIIHRKVWANLFDTFDLSIRVGRTKIFANNITIPGDKEAVDLTFYNEKGEQVEALKNSGSNFDEVTIQGIKGTLAYDSSRNIHTFTREKSGKAVTLTAPAQIEATLPEFNENDIVIIFSGNYDKQNNQDVYRTITYQRAILNQIKTQKYIVVSMTSKRQNNLVRDDNNILKEEHKDHFLDFRTYLLTNGLKDANITATEQDQKDLTNSYIPSSLLKEDKFAGNDTFNQLLANQIYQKLQELQYVK